MFARFDENPAMTLQDIKETKRYGRTHGRTDNVKTVYPPQTKCAGGIIIQILFCKRGYDLETIFDHTLARRGAIVDQTSKVALGRCELPMLAQHINVFLELYFHKSDDQVKQIAMHIKKNKFHN